MAKNFVYIGIAVLALIAVVLGYKIYQQRLSYTLPQTNQSQNRPATGTVVNQATPGGAQNTAQNIDLDSLFKQFPGANATTEEKTKFNSYLLSIGQETGTLVINNCKVTPLVFRVKKGVDFMVSNLDNKDHTLNVNQVTFSVKAKETKKLTTDNLDGAYGYYCDGVGPRVGILHVVQ